MVACCPATDGAVLRALCLQAEYLKKLLVVLGPLQRTGVQQSGPTKSARRRARLLRTAGRRDGRPGAAAVADAATECAGQQEVLETVPILKSEVIAVEDASEALVMECGVYRKVKQLQLKRQAKQLKLGRQRQRKQPVSHVMGNLGVHNSMQDEDLDSSYEDSLPTELATASACASAPSQVGQAEQRRGVRKRLWRQAFRRPWVVRVPCTDPQPELVRSIAQLSDNLSVVNGLLIAAAPCFSYDDEHSPALSHAGSPWQGS